MAEEHPTTELTIRDVLIQIDRRLTRVEDDVRSIDNKMGALDTKVDHKIGALDTKVDHKVEILRKDINTRFQ